MVNTPSDQAGGSDASPPPMEQLAAHWTRAQPVVWVFILSAIPDIHAAQDVLQQVAMTAVNKFDTFDNARPFAAWAMGIARFEVLKYQRTRSRDRHVFDGEVLKQLAAECSNLDQGDLDRMDQILRRCIRGLTRRAYQMLQLRYAHGHSPGQIADMLGLKLSNVYVAIQRCRDALYDCVHEAEMDSEPSV